MGDERGFWLCHHEYHYQSLFATSSREAERLEKNGWKCERLEKGGRAGGSGT